MKNQSLILSAILATAVLASCGKEELKNKQSDAALNFRSGSSSISVTANWAEGATTILNGTVHTAQSNTVEVWNNFSNGTSGRIGFQRWDQSGNANFGRTNGPGDNGVATHAFAYKVNTWDAAVPFAFGSRNNREAIWTPKYENNGINVVNMGVFVTDNGTGDEDNTTGIIEVGNWRAVQLTVVDGTNTRKRVSIEEKVGSSWVQRVRTNNNNGIVQMLAFTVLDVRTDYTVSGGKVTAHTFKTIPVLKSQIVGINNSVSNGPIALWTLQKGGQVNYNDEMFRF